LTARALHSASALGSGALFAVGLVVSGMTRPEKVVGFLDVGGAWDPSLAFVMAGAIAVHAVVYRWVRGKGAPRFASKFHLPARRGLDFKLVLGAALFGMGWGVGGYCPGPGIVSLASGSAGSVTFVVAMLLGMVVTEKLEARASAGAGQVVESAEG
jgi:uncharacterized membrane protein YedE/YeeE